MLATITGEGTGDFEKTATVLVATLLRLAILEHFFLVLPVQDSALWNWALRLAGNPALGREEPGGLKPRRGIAGQSENICSASAWPTPRPQLCQ
ncbi:MAG: DUF3623 family protein [Gammaproteobacteria bacterium]|nr:DUF3623 family protein [Gammaproteobacteria bacterium]